METLHLPLPFQCTFHCTCPCELGATPTAHPSTAVPQAPALSAEHAQQGFASSPHTPCQPVLGQARARARQAGAADGPMDRHTNSWPDKPCVGVGEAHVLAQPPAISALLVRELHTLAVGQHGGLPAGGGRCRPGRRPCRRVKTSAVLCYAGRALVAVQRARVGGPHDMAASCLSVCYMLHATRGGSALPSTSWGT
jgi:hypothetical protein